MANDSLAPPTGDSIEDTDHMMDAVKELKRCRKSASPLRAMFGVCDAGTKPVETTITNARTALQQSKPNASLRSP